MDENTPRGTIVVEKVHVRAGPGEKEAQLFELFEGNEVLILRVDDDWAQIQFPGAFTGWIPQSAIFQNFGKNLVLTKFSSTSKLGQ